MGRLDRYLAKEILLPFAAGLLFLTQILLATQLLSQADVLFGSGVSLLDVGAVTLSVLPQLLGQVIPVAFLLGAVLGVGRLAEDREVVAMGAAGLSPARLVRVPLLLSVGVAALGLWLSLSVEPAALRAGRLRLNDIVKRNVTNDVRSGTFYDQIPSYTLYAERAAEGRWENVLIHDRSNPAAPVLALARRGRLEPVGEGEDMRLVLEQGELHREQLDSDDYAAATFRTAELVVALGDTLTDRNSLSRTSRDATVPEALARVAAYRAAGRLEDARHDEAVLGRRISAPLVVLALAILAVPIGAARRGGRAFGIGATFGVIVLHYLLLRGSEVLAQRGDLPAIAGLQLPNLVLAALGLALLWQLDRRGPGAVR
ncbi:MAG TPA: LptF/LptG family permease [Anaeromyxobacter sp.]|nr:LptF/LptG family permease [Anaeromyxobacter sp.]